MDLVQIAQNRNTTDVAMGGSNNNMFGSGLTGKTAACPSDDVTVVVISWCQLTLAASGSTQTWLRSQVATGLAAQGVLIADQTEDNPDNLLVAAAATQGHFTLGVFTKKKQDYIGMQAKVRSDNIGSTGTVLQSCGVALICR